MWQFDALDLRPVVRWLEARRVAAPAGPTPVAIPRPGVQGFPVVAFEPGPGCEIRDTYLDTADWRFHRAGLALRIRSQNNEHHASLRGLSVDANGRNHPVEIESPLANGDIQELLQAQGRAGEWVRALSGREPPASLFSLKASRQPYTVLMDGRPVGEVVLDETSVATPSGDEAMRLRRVEIEVKTEAAESLRPFVDDLKRSCRLTPSVASKYEAGLMTLDLTPFQIPYLGPLTLDRDPSMGQLAYAVLRRAFQGVLQNEPGTRIGEDAEALHDMRVAIRRMRAAMSLFEPALPIRARSARRELRWIARKLGQVRDLDIQLARMRTWLQAVSGPEASSLELVMSAMLEKRRRARNDMLRALDTRRYARLVSRLVRTLSVGPPRRSPAARTPALAAFPALILERHASAVAAGDGLGPDSPPEAYHRLRIRLKRLRYAVENARDLYAAPAAGYVTVLTRLQDLLGEHQDAYVAVAQIHGLLESGHKRIPVEMVFMMGRISERYRQAAARQRKRYRKTFQPVTGKAWSRLQKAVEKGLAKRGSVVWPPHPKPTPVPTEPAKEP